MDSGDLIQVLLWPLGRVISLADYLFSLFRPVTHILASDTALNRHHPYKGNSPGNTIANSDVICVSLCHLSAQDQQGRPSKRSDPPKKAQIIEPVLRHAPQRRAAHQTAAAYLRTVKANSDAPNNKRPKLDHTASPQHPSHPSREDKHQDIYRQQIQDALRDASPDGRAGPSTAWQQNNKRPTRMAPQRQRPVSPAVQDLGDR